VRRALRIAPVVALAVAGVLALLLARDVDHRRASFVRDDALLRTAPLDARWSPQQLLPFGAATALLAVGDDVAYRRALRSLRLGTPHTVVFDSPTAIALRAEAQLRLARIAQSDRDRTRRSAAENFLGGLSFAGAAGDPDSEASLLENAVASFRSAIADDERNDDAKYNLELALSRLRQVQSTTIPRSTIGNASSGRGAGVGRAGSGY
jgi:hypothetical protein